MLKHLGKWLKIYQDEIGLFLWSALVLFLIRSSNILFNNFAETAFLKRFGVEYLPYVTAVNSVATFLIMGFLTGFMVRIPGNRLLSLIRGSPSAFSLSLRLEGSSAEFWGALEPLCLREPYP